MLCVADRAIAAVMSEAREPLVWLDMEMTGLDPERCAPIEVAVLITSPDLDELDSMEMVIWQPPEVLDRMEPFVRRMHTENGLLSKVRASEFSVADAEKKILSLLARWTKPGEGVLSGNSIHQDRRFLARYFPTVHGYLHYRMVDVSTVKELARRWYGAEALFTKGNSDHTALADIRSSVAELKHYRSTLFRTPTA